MSKKSEGMFYASLSVTKNINNCVVIISGVFKLLLLLLLLLQATIFSSNNSIFKILKPFLSGTHLSINCCLVQGHQFSSQQGFLTGSSEHGQFSGSAAVHEPFAVTQAQHHTSYGHATSVPISFAGTTQIRGNNKS